MNESIIAVRYTKALFGLAESKNILEAVNRDMLFISESMLHLPDLRLFFQNPVISPKKKYDASSKLFIGFNTTTIGFINLLIKNKREEYLEDIARNFIERYRKHKGIVSAVFTSAVAVNAETLNKIKAIIGSALKAEVEIQDHVSEKIIGGFILRVGDKQLDASIQNGLNKYKRQLLNTTAN